MNECRIKEFILFYLLKIAERSDIHNSSIVIRHSIKFHTRCRVSAQTSRISKGGIAPGLRSLFGGVGMLDLLN